MPTYVTLMRFTDQGIRNIKESPARLEAAKKLFQSAGAEIKSFYLALGNYDAVLVVEGPNDETAARVALSIGSLGNVRTDTMRVFTEPEYRKLISSMP
ncbi:MAG TPA: GYD domain-containing protein [Myxococcaceae bacterium]|nr:GYD domain-containing protein [Myxococcaceae bacterium]